MTQQAAGPCTVQGNVAAGFESVRDLFERNMNTWAEENAQLCVYHRGERVVDLWASTTGDDNFGPDSLINVFSSGKSLECIALAALVDKGLLDYDSRIVDYWPEFGAGGKGEVTVADLMRHEGGLANFSVPMELDDLLTHNIKDNRVGSIIEREELAFNQNNGNRRDYHAVTRGWIANELFRRVDPAGRTMGEFLREDISAPLGADAQIGLKREELSRVSRIKLLGLGRHLLESLKPKFLGRKVVHNIFQIIGRLVRMLPAIRAGLGRERPPAPYKGMDSIGFFNEHGIAMGETPSAAANCSARGLARIAAMMSGGGTLDGRQYLGREAWEAMHDEASEAQMGGFMPTRFTQGGVAHFTECGPGAPRMARDFNTGREDFYGWMGLGGSIFQWNPDSDIGFAFVPTSLHLLDFLNERGKTYQAEVMRCVDRMRAGSAA